MQTRNKIMEDISQLMTNAMGVAQGAKEESETAMKSMMDRWLADRDFVNPATSSRPSAPWPRESPGRERGAEGAALAALEEKG